MPRKKNPSLKTTPPSQEVEIIEEEITEIKPIHRLFVFVAHGPEIRHEETAEGKIKVTKRKEKVVFYTEKQAVIFGPKMKEYLGIYITDNPEDKSILTQTASEIRALNLPKTNPVDQRKTVISQGVERPLTDYPHLMR